MSITEDLDNVPCLADGKDGGSHYSGDDCQVTPVIHVLQYPGCVPKPIPSFACIGRCASYIQVSGSKIWQMERSCMCCQESGEREASVSLFCPKAKNGEKKFRKVGSDHPDPRYDVTHAVRFRAIR
ncbi:bursicon [Anopheles moucheti]|uniref:bursicon n=1 Tax=Anopheles moucheti TaxID=186751 RepID=UPI0022F11B5E|nr:bursicon [Anopheles moucheti]